MSNTEPTWSSGFMQHEKKVKTVCALSGGLTISIFQNQKRKQDKQEIFKGT